MNRHLRRWPPFGIVGAQLPGWLCKIIGHHYEFAGWGKFGPDGPEVGQRRCSRCGRDGGVGSL